MEWHTALLAAATNPSASDVKLFESAGARIRHLPTGPAYMLHGALCFNDEELATSIIELAHESTIHGSARPTRAKLSNVWFPGLPSKIDKWVRSCRTCQLEPARIARQAPPHGPMNLRPQPAAAWDTVSIDHVPLGTDPTGKVGVLHIQDHASRFSVFVPTFTLGAEEVVDALNDHTGVFGPINTIIHDSASCFLGNAFKSWCSTHNVKPSPTHPYTPHSNGQIERTHGPLRRALGLLSGQDRAHWTHIIKRAQYVLNTTVNRSIGISPWQYIFASNPPTLISVIPDIIERSLAMDAADSLRVVAHMHSLWSATINKLAYDATAEAVTLKAGDFVVLRVPQDSKQQPAWVGPYRIKGPEPERSGYYLVEQTDRTGRVANIVSTSVEHLRLYDNSRPGQSYTAPLRHGTHLPVSVSGDRGTGPRRQLSITWEDGSTSWEPIAGPSQNYTVTRHPLVRTYLSN